MKRLLSLLAALALTTSLTGCVVETTTSSDSESRENSAEPSTQDANDSSSSETESAETTPEEVGLPVPLGSRYVDEAFAMTINSARTDPGGSFAEPEEDYFLILDVTLENLDDESTNISTLLQFELQGSDDFKYDLSIFADTKGDLGGSLASGSKVRGEVAFDVPALDSYTVLYQHDLFSDSVPFIIASTDLNAEPSSSESSDAAEPSTSAGVGDTVTQGGVSMTINSVRTTTDGAFGADPEEEIYLVIDATIENNTDDSLNLSELLSYELRGSDSYGYDVDIFVDKKGDLGGEVRPESKLRGEIAYDVPVLDFYEFIFEPSFFSGEPITFVIDGGQL
jgi:hypothetical protein